LQGPVRSRARRKVQRRKSRYDAPHDCEQSRDLARSSSHPRAPASSRAATSRSPCA
jgi:hypothetical protein